MFGKSCESNTDDKGIVNKRICEVDVARQHLTTTKSVKESQGSAVIVTAKVSDALINLDEMTTYEELSITLVRHGESTWNELGLIQGHDNTATLTLRGREQALGAGHSLRELGFDHVVTSDLDRARETAEIIGKVLGVAPVLDTLLRERGFGELEGRPLNELQPSLTGIDKNVIVNPDASPRGGESFREVVNRASLFLKQLRDERPGRRVLVVSHGGTIRALRASIEGEPLEGRPWYVVGNCSIWPLTVHGVDH